MQVTCASCKTTYNLTPEQVRSLSYSILPCTTCSKFIKITTCPHCNSYYSITFTSAQQSHYRLTCERCAKPFVIDFPVIKDASKNVNPPANKQRHRLSFFRKIISGKKESAPRAAAPPRYSSAFTSNRPMAPSQTGQSVTLGNLLLICGTAFTVQKLVVASVAILCAFVSVLGGNWLIGNLIDSGFITGNEYIKSLLSIIPFAIVFFWYIMASAGISRLTMDGLKQSPGFAISPTGMFLLKAIGPILFFNIIIFMIIDLIFVLFGKIPVIGPVLFAVMFLPLYITSLCSVILLAIGFWFYPPIIADSIPGGKSPFVNLFRFIREQNFSLVYTIPLMVIITAGTFGVVYLMHYGSLSLSVFLSKSILGDEGIKVFASIPSTLLQLSDLALIGSDSGLYKSFLTTMVMSHTMGGFIMGIIFSVISILLFASFISITATLSTSLYIMMEKKVDMDDSNKIKLLVLLVLILLCIFLVKKIIF